MAEFAMPVVGNFCWVEANVEDPAALRGFYGELFGWAAEDMATPMGAYTMMRLGGKNVAGLMKLPEPAKKMGAPPHWLNYVAVEDASKAADKAKGLGATVLVSGMKAGPGTMSVIQDPTGGVVALWAQSGPMGTFVWGETNTLCWTELASTDPAKASIFYTALFGWTTEAMPMGDMTYTIVKNGGTPIGGIMPQPKMMAGGPSVWTSYFAVAACDATAKKAEQMGGNVLMPPTDIPEVGRFAVLTDPQGTAFAIIQQPSKK